MKTNEMTRGWMLFAVLALVAALSMALLAGCSDEGQQEESSSSTEAIEGSTSEGAEVDPDASLSEPAEMLLYVGADTATTSSVIIKNELGADITFVSIIPTGAQDEPLPLSIEGGTWNQGRLVALFFEPAGEGATYDLVFTADGDFYDLKGADLTTNREVVLKANGATAYLEPLQR